MRLQSYKNFDETRTKGMNFFCRCEKFCGFCKFPPRLMSRRYSRYDSRHETPSQFPADSQLTPSCVFVYGS